MVAIVSTAVAETARDILDRRRRLDETQHRWTDREQAITLHVRTRYGRKPVRELTVYERKRPDGGEQTILFFERPAAARGMGFLSFSRADGPADQRLYMPALGRVRSIRGDERNDSFLGTDLTYNDVDLLQDMPAWTEDEAATTLAGEADMDGVATHVIDLRPRRADVGYGRIRIWLGKDDLISRRTHFFRSADDPLDAPATEILQSQVKRIGTIPVPHRVEVRRPANRSGTIMEVRRVRFDQGLGEDLFTQRALERGERPDERP
jgi:hypothetical protein